MESSFIQLDAVHKAFGTNAVLKGLSVSIERGRVTTIIGRSGTGKSVMLKHIAGLLAPDQGAILFDGQDLVQLRRWARRKIKGRFSYMFQRMALFDSMTVRENIALPLEESSRIPLLEIKARVLKMARAMEIQDALEKYPSELSGGMSKRVAFARALITEPEIVLFDEPTTGLDPVRRHMVHNMIARQQAEKGFTAVVVSHDIPEVFDISHKVAMLEDGVIIASGTPADIQASTDRRVRRFVEGKSDAETSF